MRAGLGHKARMTVQTLPDPSDARVRPVVFVLGVVIAAVQTFALGATGSIAVAAALAATALHLSGLVGGVLTRRGEAGPAASPDRSAARVFVAGMGLASGLVIGAVALFGLFQPQPAGAAGAIGVVAMVLACALALTGSSVPGLRPAAGSGEEEAGADPSVGLVAATGLAAAAFLAAPELDAAAGLIVALWLVWGAISDMRSPAQ
jgi:hypothetical protein